MRLSLGGVVERWKGGKWIFTITQCSEDILTCFPLSEIQRAECLH